MVGGEWACQNMPSVIAGTLAACWLVFLSITPSPFFAVGQSYWDFTQTTDEEVRDLLRAAGAPVRAAGNGGPPSEVAILRMSAALIENGVPPEETLFSMVGDAQLVLIGEASHGTHDFYAARAEMTRRLIEHRGFAAWQSRRTGQTPTG
jgi:hypothetical protein